MKVECACKEGSIKNVHGIARDNKKKPDLIEEVEQRICQYSGRIQY